MIDLIEGHGKTVALDLFNIFLGKFSATVGMPFESLLSDHFTYSGEGLVHMNSKGSNDAVFGDLRTDGVVFSVKYSGAGTWNKMFGDNFRVGTMDDYVPVICGNYWQTGVQKFYKRFGSDLLSRDEVLDLVTANRDHFSVIWGENVCSDVENAILGVNWCEPISSSVFKDRLLEVHRTRDILASNVRSALSKVFDEKFRKEFILPLEGPEVKMLKAELDEVIRKVFHGSIDSLRRDLLRRINPKRWKITSASSSLLEFMEEK